MRKEGCIVWDACNIGVSSFQEPTVEEDREQHPRLRAIRDYSVLGGEAQLAAISEERATRSIKSEVQRPVDGNSVSPGIGSKSTLKFL